MGLRATLSHEALGATALRNPHSGLWAQRGWQSLMPYALPHHKPADLLVPIKWVEESFITCRKRPPEQETGTQLEVHCGHPRHYLLRNGYLSHPQPA